MPPASMTEADAEVDEAEQSIWAIVDEVLAESASDDLQVLAKEVLERIDDEHWRDLLVQAVIMLLQQSIKSHRRAVQRFAHDGSVTPRHHRNARSWRNDAASLYLALLNTRESVADNEYRALGECTAADLKVIIARRIAQAKAAIGAIERYKKLLKALQESKVQVVADLPEQKLMEAMQ